MIMREEEKTLEWRILNKSQGFISSISERDIKRDIRLYKKDMREKEKAFKKMKKRKLKIIKDMKKDLRRLKMLKMLKKLKALFV